MQTPPGLCVCVFIHVDLFIQTLPQVRDNVFVQELTVSP